MRDFGTNRVNFSVNILWPNQNVMKFSCRYASLYFCMCIDQSDNELEVLEIIHHFVEILDRYFGSVSLQSFCLYIVVFLMSLTCSSVIAISLIHVCLFFCQVCELDLIFNFHKVNLFFSRIWNLRGKTMMYGIVLVSKSLKHLKTKAFTLGL